MEDPKEKIGFKPGDEHETLVAFDQAVLSKIPKYCGECPVADWEFEWCGAHTRETGDPEIKPETKPDWCPLVELAVIKKDETYIPPEGHRIYGLVCDVMYMQRRK